MKALRKLCLKIALSAALAAGASLQLFSGAAEEGQAAKPAVDFRDASACGAFGNAGFSVLESSDAPLRGPSAKIKLGGVGKDPFGGFQITRIAKDSLNAGADSLSFWLKGDGLSGSFIVTLNDSKGRDWCWNGKRWEGQAEISTAVKSWKKVACLLKDFRPGLDGAKYGAETPLPGEIVKICFSIGRTDRDLSRQICSFEISSPVFERFSEEPSSEIGLELESLPRFPLKAPKASSGFELGETRLPAGISWDLAKAFQKDSGARMRICLDNYWQFQPVAGSATRDLGAKGAAALKRPAGVPRGGKWGFVKVPGTWADHMYNVLDENGDPVSKWQERPLAEFTLAWIRREINVPAEWKGRCAILEFELVERKAALFVNGRYAGDIEKCGKADVSEALIPGRANEIALLVDAPLMPLNDANIKNPKMGPKWWYSWHDGPGLCGDVWLDVSKAKSSAMIESSSVVTSVAEGRISANVALSASGPFSGELRGEVMDGGRKALSFKPVKLSLAQGESKTVALSEAWPDPELWSHENPKLYELSLSLVPDGASEPSDGSATRFGFRELSVKGGDFLLNGKKLRLRFQSYHGHYMLDPDEVLLQRLKAYKELNCNGIFVEELEGRLIRACDELGLMVMIRHVFTPLVREGEYMPGIPAKGYPFQIYLSNEPNMLAARRELQSKIASVVRQYRNSPSIVIWAINPALCYTNDWIDPNSFFKERAMNDLFRASFAEERFIRSLDPTRLVVNSMSGNVGAVNSVNPYPTFCEQPEEWADWPELWSAKKGSFKPVFVEEVAIPIDENYTAWRSESKNKEIGWGLAKPIIAEQAARSLGEEAYLLTPARTEKAPGMLSVAVEKNGFASWGVLDEAHVKSKLGWMRRVYDAWRFHDVSAICPFENPMELFSFGSKAQASFEYADLTRPGRKPDYCSALDFSKRNAIHKALQETQRPFLARIGGRAGRFSSEEHSYWSGEKAAKQILLSNESLSPLNVGCKWTLSRAGEAKALKEGSWSGALETGAVLKIPFEFELPEASSREDFVLRLEALAGQLESSDQLALSVFPRAGLSVASAPLLLYDEKGLTREALRAMKVPFEELKQASMLKAGSPLVVGRESFSPAFLQLAKEGGLQKLVEDGMSVLFFEQTDSSPMSLYLEERRERQSFIRLPGHPALKGVREDDLRHWRGASDLVVDYPQASYQRKGRFIPWGSEGNLASFVMDKPFLGRFRAILDCDADLSRTSLLECGVGKGRMIFCQLDLTGRFGKDPTATAIAKNLIEYLNKPIPFPSVRVAYAGSEEFRLLLKERFMVEPEPLAPGQSLEGFDALVLGPPPYAGALADACSSFVRAGGRVLALPQDSKDVARLPLPFALASRPEKARKASFKTGSDSLLQGLGASDFYFNDEIEMTALDNLPEGSFKLSPAVYARVPYGKGEFAILLTAPVRASGRNAELKADRILATALSNIGAPCSAKMGFDRTEPVEVSLDGLSVPFKIDPKALGTQEAWFAPSFDDSSWRKLKVGLQWESQGVGDANALFKSQAYPFPYDGDAWYRIHVKIPEALKGKELSLDIERVDDLDHVYFNGQLIGKTGKDTKNYWEFHRLYKIPERLVQFDGDNVIAVRVQDLGGEGGILGRAKITWPGAKASNDLLYPRPSRLLFDFDPNSWRQW